MSTTRRRFLSSLSIPVVAPMLAPRFSTSAGRIAAHLASHTGTPETVAGDEDFWAEVGRAFTIDRSVVNLNNGGVSPSPGFVQEAMKRHLDFSNTTPPPVALWQILEPRKEEVRSRLAREWGVDAEEIALTRNSSESLQICQFGFDLNPGDEVLTTTQDYPRMIATFKQRQRREGVVLKQFSLPVPCEDDAEVVRLFEANITPRTRLILMCHMVFLTGQVLPVKRVAAMARERGIPVIVDGAHALAHIDFKLSDLECDYYAVSLHKWLFAPHGTGMLYVRRNKVRGLWPLMAAGEELDDDIRKFEEIGTHPAANALAIAEALTFHQSLGGARKQARLVHLREHWMGRLSHHQRVRFNTSRRPGFAGGLANMHIDGVDHEALAEWLWNERRILTVAIAHEECPGLRIAPSVYTTRDELDRFCDAVEWAVAHGLPAPG